MSNNDEPKEWVTVTLHEVCARTLESHQRLSEASGLLAIAALELDGYREYIESNLDRIERDGWTPVCFDEFRESEENSLTLGWYSSQIDSMKHECH